MSQLYNLMHMRRFIPLIITVASGVFADKIVQREKDGSIISKETDNVTLKFSYESTSSGILLYWYRQRANGAPQYLLYRGAKSYSSYKSTPADTRLEAKTTDTSTELTISGLKLTDSALYYCALRDTWTTTELTFGKPIKLTVNPKDDKPKVPPTLSILSPQGGDGPQMCLAAGFFPKQGTLTLTEGDKTVPHEVDKAVLSTTSGNYYYAKYSTEKIEACEMNGIKEIRKDSDAKEKSKEGNQIDCKSRNEGTSKTEEINNTDDFKSNSLSLLVTGLRLLLAKAVAVNVMMTIKAFLT